MRPLRVFFYESRFASRARGFIVNEREFKLTGVFRGFVLDPVRFSAAAGLVARQIRDGTYYTGRSTALTSGSRACQQLDFLPHGSRRLFFFIWTALISSLRLAERLQYYHHHHHHRLFILLIGSITVIAIIRYCTYSRPFAT